MKAFRLLPCLLLPLAFPSALLAQTPAPAPATAPAAKGEVLHFTLENSKVFPGTTRQYWIYIPAAYQPSQPACLYVHQDGVANNAPAVFDELIAKGQMPVTIGVFVQPGRVKAVAPQTGDRVNRSFEYDSLSPDYARFLATELLPDVEKKTASDGRPIRLSPNPNDRAIGGHSSGAIAALNAAFERPDLFHRVFSAIGSFTDIRGGDKFASLIRKTEPKPLRIFLQDGSQDLHNPFGDWWMANQTLERALAFAGYELAHSWGTGGHNSKEIAPIFPEAIRFLWKDWPAPVQAGLGSDAMQKILLPGEAWELVSEGHRFLEGPAVNAQGELFFNDVPTSKTYRLLPDGKIDPFIEESGRGDGQSFGPDGRLYAAAGGENKIVAYRPDGSMAVIAEGFRGNDLVVRHDGRIYVTEPGWNGKDPSRIWLIQPDGSKQVVDTGLKFSNGITLSPDQSLLYVADTRSRWVYSYQIQNDGTLAHKQRFFQLHLPDTADDSGADGLEVDREGRLFVATRLGIQVCDPAGRVQCILPTPNGKVANMVFGGPQFDILYAACGDKLFKRKLRTRGTPSFLPPIPNPKANGG
ncbi:MAG: Gluconolactonase precursor [Verrucomicrobiota bacterium]|jgi:sugar lactone lactonase YvrE/enterochelin esterase-like enzyme